MFWRCYFLSRTQTRLTTLAMRCRLGNMAESAILERTAVVRHGRRLEYFTIAWNALEGLVAVVAGAIAGSISLVGFGIDSFIEVTSGSVLLWRMSVDAQVRHRELNERRALRIVGVCFLLLAAYIAYESVSDLWSRRAPEHSIPGIILACISGRNAPSLTCQAESGARPGQRSHARRRETDGVLHLPVGDPAGRVVAQRPLGLVVGRPCGGAHHASHHCKRGH